MSETRYRTESAVHSLLTTIKETRMSGKTITRLAELGRVVAGTLIETVGEGLVELAELLRGGTAEPDGEPRDGCGHGHAHAPMSPAFEAMLARRFGGAPEDGETARGREWGPAFADSVTEGDLVALTGEQLGRRDLGLRALTVRKRREDPDGMFGGRALTLLLEDADSGEVHSPTVGADFGLRIAAAAPDEVPADLAGGAA